MEENNTITARTTAWEEYVNIIDGKYADGVQGKINFAVSSTEIDSGKGDLFVALGLSRALKNNGWGVQLYSASEWATADWSSDVIISMLEWFIPARLPSNTLLVAWIRNWTRKWIDLPFLSSFNAILTSSRASAAAVSKVYKGAIEIFPIGVDLDFFYSPVNKTRETSIVTTVNFWGSQRQIQTELKALAKSHQIDWFGGNQSSMGEIPGVIYRGKVLYQELPEIYSSSQLVIDDLIPPAKEFDNQNSRLFDSIASGALPITNSSAIGLTELGLNDVIAYQTSQELLEIVNNFLDDEDKRLRVVQNLQETVRSKHSYAHRALFLEGFIKNLDPKSKRELPEWLTWVAELNNNNQNTQKALIATQNHADNLQDQITSLETQIENLQIHSRNLQNHADALQNHSHNLLENFRNTELALQTQIELLRSRKAIRLIDGVARIFHHR